MKEIIPIEELSVMSLHPLKINFIDDLTVPESIATFRHREMTKSLASFTLKGKCLLEQRFLSYSTF
jgi:hypothetical protein